MSEYGVQLREKQKVRRVYMVLERQFKRYFETAESRPGVTGENLLRLLETRLDNVVFRMGFASQPRPGPPARQPRPLHGQRPAPPASPRTRSGTATASRSARRSRNTEYFKHAQGRASRGAQRPDWLNVDADKLAGTVTALPRRDQMPLELNEQLVVEYYSR